MIPTPLLEIIVSVIFFGNKLFLLYDKKLGWMFGAVGAACAILYFLQIKLYVFAAMQGGLFVLMVYGMMPSLRKNRAVERGIIVVTIASLLVVLYGVTHGTTTLGQFIAAVGIIGGTNSLAHGKLTKGWLILLPAHVITAWVCWEEQQYIASIFQALSAVVSIAALIRIRRCKKQRTLS